MHPAGPPPSQNRSSPSPSLAQCPSPSPSLLQQQQHVIYGPITTLQACPANIHPHCVYTGIQRNSGLSASSGPLSNQVQIRHTKVTKWQPKSKLTRGHHSNHHQQSHQQYCPQLQHPQAHVQQPLTYIPKPLVLFDQCQANQQPPPGATPATSFLVASSTFAHAPYGPADHYTSASGLTLIPQPFFKAPEVTQAFCLLQERPQTTQHHHQPPSHQAQGTYYNIAAANACNFQAIKPSLQLTNITNPYGNVTTSGNNQMPAQTFSANQIYQNSSIPFGPSSRDKVSMLPNVDLQAITCSRHSTDPGDTKHRETSASRTENIDWTPQTVGDASNIFKNSDAITSPRMSASSIETNRGCCSSLTKNQEERYSDESAASFDFTIEAEKMVSALCNTVSSNELGKDETAGENETTPPFGGAAGDNVANKNNMWFTDFCTEYGVSLEHNNRTASTQTQEDRRDPQHNPEMMRKTIYWGCNEAESILNTPSYRGCSRAAWLADISSATRTAVTKSSTCFPIFSGDKTFVQDLVNALLRITNGWLVLDNYLNKQHYPNLDEKFDRELPNRFQTWEIVTQDLLRELIKTLVNVEESSNSATSHPESLGFPENLTSPSFPGDVNLYTKNDLFDSWQRYQEQHAKLSNSDRNDRDATYTLQCTPQSSTNTNFNSLESRIQSQKETKLRSKWTITENLSSTLDSAKSGPDTSRGSSDLGFPSGNRYRMKNPSPTTTTKFTSSASHSLNAEFFQLQNKVMESMGNSNEPDRQRWGLKEQQYNFVFGTSRAPGTSPMIPGSCEPIFKIRTAASSYENAYARRCLPRTDSPSARNSNAPSRHCGNANESVYLVAGPEAALDSTYLTGVGAADRIKTYAEPDYTGSVRIAELNEHNCASGIVVSATSISSSIKTEPVYVGKCSSDQPELAAVPRTKMTLLSQIEGNSPNANRETQEMTANLSAWFASMRNANNHRTIKCPVESRKPENTVQTKSSTHSHETSRSSINFTRQIHMDPNRQLQTLQNMQAIQSQPWNAANLLNNAKQTTAHVDRNLDEYDSSEDVRVYMKPGSYNVPKKRHNRKNNRKNDHSGNPRANLNTPRSHANRADQNANHTIPPKSHQLSTSVSSLLIASSVQLSTTTTTTNTSIRVPFPSATPIVPPPSNFTPHNSPRILRRLRCSSADQEKRQDVAWKAACASAEILLEALNVKSSSETCDSKSPNSMKKCQRNSSPKNKANRSTDCLSVLQESDREIEPQHPFWDVSSYEASEDDSSSTCKCSPDRYTQSESRDVKQPKTNVKTDSWLISTLNNASIVSGTKAESDRESTIGGSINSSINEEADGHEYKTVVTSTPEPMKISSKDLDEQEIEREKLVQSFPAKFNEESPRSSENQQQHSRNLYTPSRNLSISLTDTSGEFVGRATYSETVRRSSVKSGIPGKPENCRSRQTRSMSSIEPVIRGSIVPIPARKSQRKGSDRANNSIHKSRKTIAKRLSRDLDEKESEEGRSNKKIIKEETSGAGNSTRPLAVKCQTKKKGETACCSGWTETKTKVSERGWSVWYSSRRKQALSSLAFNKLATIHQTVWQMEDSKLLKYPATTSSGSIEMVEDDSRVNGSPIYLETIGYKLKNRIYHKIEQVMRDFRKIVNNSKLYHKNDSDRVAKIEMLSKKLEQLFEEHFATWDFENAFEQSPRNTNSSCNVSRSKSPQKQNQKSTTSRLTSSTKKNSATLAKNEN